MQFKPKHSLLVLALVGAFSAAHAAPLVANVLTPSVDIVAGSFGGVLVSSAVTAISNYSYNGIARTAVYQTASGLDFYYQYSNDISSKTGIDRFTGYDFTALGASVVNVYQTATAFGLFAAGTERSENADRTLFGVIGFNFVPNGQSKINPGTTSFTQIVRTNAREVAPGNFGLIDGVAANAPGFGVAPVTAIPEPETYALMLAGLGMVATIIRRRRASQV